MLEKLDELPSQNVFNFGRVTFSSNFDNGNLARVKKIDFGLPYQYKVWVAVDNEGTSFQSKQNAWFHFSVSGVPKGNTLRIQVANASNHSSLYRQDMRPVYRSYSTNDEWTRIKQSARYEKPDNGLPQLTFDHHTEAFDDVIYFAFTYPYTYEMVQNDLKIIDKLALEIDFRDSDCIYCCRELVTNSVDGLRIDLITISAVNGVNTQGIKEPNLPGLFPSSKMKTKINRKGKIKKKNKDTETSSLFNDINDNYNDNNDNRNDDYDYDEVDYNSSSNDNDHHYTVAVNDDQYSEAVSDDDSGRPVIFASKEIVFVSARVHPGEVPSQHTWKGMLDFLTDRDDVIAKELRKRYVFKMIPMLNPDGVYRGHFRMDQFGENLNRYYNEPNPLKQPSIFAAKSLIEYYAKNKKLCLYLDMHAHTSKRGCFIYGNVLDSVHDQIQNQLFCKLISLNSPHFDYEACLFDREHMQRTDPSEMRKGLTAEGSGRVATYLAHNLIHSYTLECNYNMSRVGNEITACETDPKGAHVLPVSTYDTSPAPYTPSCYAGVGRACLIALLDIRNQNPCSRITTSKYKTLDKVRQNVLEEVHRKWEYRNQSTHSLKQKTLRGLSLESQVQVPSMISNLKVSRRGRNSIRCYASACDSKIWRSYADGVLNITSNDDNDIDNERTSDDKNDNSINSNDNDRHYGDDNNNNDENAVNISGSKDTDDDNDKNGDKKKSRRKKSFEGRITSVSTYDSAHARQLKSLDSVERTLLSPRSAATASKARRQSTSSLWPRIRSTTAEVAGLQVAGLQVAGHKRAGSVGSLNLKYHRVVPLSSNSTGKHPTLTPYDPVKKVKPFSSHSTVCLKMKNGRSNANNDENNYKNLRKNSFIKIETSSNKKLSSITSSQNSKKSVNANKKDIERKRSEEKNLNVSSEKSFTKEMTDDDFNDLIDESLKISVTSSQAPIHDTCRSQKVVLNTGITGQNLHTICVRTPGEEGEGVLLSERLLSDKSSSHKSSTSKQSSLSSNKTLKKNMDKFSMSKKNNIVKIKNEYVVDNESVINGEKTPLQPYIKTKNKESIISDKSNQSTAIYLSSKNNQIFHNITPEKRITIPKIQINSNSNDSTEVSLESVKIPLTNDSDRSNLEKFLANHHRNSFPTNENLRDTSAVEKEIRKKRNSVPQLN